jgi:hypothetical protein
MGGFSMPHVAGIEFPLIIHYLLYSCIVQRDSYSTVCISKNKKMHAVRLYISGYQ